MSIGENTGVNIGENADYSIIETGEEPIGTIFNDSFESGDMSTTNADGFNWRSLNKTSIVTRNAACSSPGTDVVIWNGSTICTEVIPSTREWTAKDGDNSLRFRYAALENWTEQEFATGTGYTELWVSYWMKVPINFARGSTGSPSNNKWFKMWMGDHSVYDNGNISHFVTHDYPGSPSTTINMGLTARSGDGPSNSDTTYTDFITVADAGRWMHIVYHMKASSGSGATDGLAAFYRKWENASSYETIGELNNIDFAVSAASVANGYSGWGSADMMGYANMPYDTDTEWLLDSFRLSENDLRII